MYNNLNEHRLTGLAARTQIPATGLECAAMAGEIIQLRHEQDILIAALEQIANAAYGTDTPKLRARAVLALNGRNN